MGRGWHSEAGRKRPALLAWHTAHSGRAAHPVRLHAPPTAAVLVRLANVTSTPDGRWSGRLEVQHQGAWLPACASGLDAADATVACRQMGLGTFGTVVPGSRFGPGAGGLWLEALWCAGTEAELSSCPGAVWGSTKCPGHSQDAGLVCSGLARECRDASNALRCFQCCRLGLGPAHWAAASLLCGRCLQRAASVRLVGPSASARPMLGRLEVRRPDGGWTSVCDDGFTGEPKGRMAGRQACNGTGRQAICMHVASTCPH